MSSESIRRYVSLATAMLLLVILHLVRPNTSILWQETLFNWLHVPVFSLAAIGLFHALGHWRSNVNKAILAFGAAIVLAIVSEAAQIPTSRDASWSDIFSDVIGAAIGLLTIPTVTQRAHLKIVSRSIAVLLLLATCLPLMIVTAAYLERDRVFPVLYDGVWPSRSEFMSLRAMAIDFHNLHPDWQEYSSLMIDVEVESDQEFELTVRVHDKEHRRGTQPHSDRFNRRFTLKPGRAEVVIPLADIESGPSNRRMDMSRIDGLVLFSNEDEDKHVVRLHRVWLD